jgi:hypothetical protein
MIREPEPTRAGVVLLEADDRVVFAGTAACELLNRYFGERRVRLPHALASWLRERRLSAAGEPLSIDAGDRSPGAAMDAPAYTAAAFVQERRLLSQTADPRLQGAGSEHHRSATPPGPVLLLCQC